MITNEKYSLTKKCLIDLIGQNILEINNSYLIMIYHLQLKTRHCLI